MSQLNTKLRGYGNGLLRGQSTKTQDIQKMGFRREHNREKGGPSYIVCGGGWRMVQFLDLVRSYLAEVWILSGFSSL